MKGIYLCFVIGLLMAVLSCNTHLGRKLPVTNLSGIEVTELVPVRYMDKDIGMLKQGDDGLFIQLGEYADAPFCDSLFLAYDLNNRLFVEATLCPEAHRAFALYKHSPPVNTELQKLQKELNKEYQQDSLIGTPSDSVYNKILDSIQRHYDSIKAANNDIAD